MRHNISLSALHSPKRDAAANVSLSPPEDHPTHHHALLAITDALGSLREAFLSLHPAVVLIEHCAGRKRLLELCQFIDRVPGPVGLSSLVDTLVILRNRLGCSLVPTTVRDIYYHHVDTYRHQQQRCIANLTTVSAALRLDLRSQLMIYPLQKGFMYGSFSFAIDGAIHEMNYSNEPVLIPLLYPRKLSVPPNSNRLRAIIVVEKEAVFKSFCYHLRTGLGPSNLLVLTGKGYPDNLTREFLGSVASITKAPVIVFVDADVYGAGICLQYARRPKPIPLIYGGTMILDFSRGWLQINRRDVCCTMSMMKTDFLEMNTLKRDIQRGLLLLIKAEMDIVESGKEEEFTGQSVNGPGKDGVSPFAPVPLVSSAPLGAPPKTAPGCIRYMTARIGECLQLHNST